MATIEDDGWEYEYDETETEDFYIPIDLSNVPSAQIPINTTRRPGHPTFMKSRLRALNAARVQVPDRATEGSTAQEMASMGEVQVSGLHTPNPLVMYNGQLLSCHWTSTIGTDMFFTKHEGSASDENQPLRSLPSVDLLSLGTAKLVARVGRLRPRDDLFDDNGDAQVPINSGGVAGNDPSVSVSVPPSQAASGRQPAASNFLTKLNQVKAIRGETTRLVVAQTVEGTRLLSEQIIPNTTLGQGVIVQQPEDTVMGGT
jgi:hypothetical protein